RFLLRPNTHSCRPAADRPTDCSGPDAARCPGGGEAGSGTARRRPYGCRGRAGGGLCGRAWKSNRPAKRKEIAMLKGKLLTAHVTYCARLIQLSELFPIVAGRHGQMLFPTIAKEARSVRRAIVPATTGNFPPSQLFRTGIRAFPTCRFRRPPRPAENR